MIFSIILVDSSSIVKAYVLFQSVLHVCDNVMRMNAIITQSEFL